MTLLHTTPRKGPGNNQRPGAIVLERPPVGLFEILRNTFGVAGAALSLGRLQLGSLPGIERTLGPAGGLIDLALLQKLFRRLVALAAL
jgi:hypothetical protein